MSTNLVHSGSAHRALSIQPEVMGWQHLAFEVRRLEPGEHLAIDPTLREVAVVPMTGRALAEVDGASYALARAGVFEEPASLLYLPPGTDGRLTAVTEFEVAIGSAPATGVYPVRLITPADVDVEIRGGGNARRQVNHLLAPPLPAERLIIYEVFVPGGSWAGWPPHRHDGVDGSPYLEETYFFRFDSLPGFGFHRNYDCDGAAYDETFAVRNGDCVAVPKGFHVTASAPGNNMWILNFLAGELIGDARATPPYFDPATTWIRDDWSKGQMALPLGEAWIGDAQ